MSGKATTVLRILGTLDRPTGGEVPIAGRRTCQNRFISLSWCLRVRALARRKSTTHSVTLRAAGIELDPTTGNVTRNRRTISLTAKERAVLEALLRASPAGLSAEKLLEQAWDENADPFTNTVRVTIARLRRKLGAPKVIQTTPGIGYRIANTDGESGFHSDA